ncbi:AIR synthase related protein [Natronoarchaeum sp. GCM10025703]|uniref:AIR synthase related protein n=1 Tax=Natronoarchaeum sp. GCM10025703 TaxID=3252685 RepID=UPI0036164D56
MDERAALLMLETELDAAGDDAAVVGEQVITTDMLHERTDFPEGTTRYTAGWRAVGASLSDVAAMGAEATAAVAIYAAPEFDRTELAEFVDGARDVCESVDGAYVGGDLDDHVEFTVATTAVGEPTSQCCEAGRNRATQSVSPVPSVGARRPWSSFAPGRPTAETSYSSSRLGSLPGRRSHPRQPR